MESKNSLSKEKYDIIAEMIFQYTRNASMSKNII